MSFVSLEYGGLPQGTYKKTTVMPTIMAQTFFLIRTGTEHLKLWFSPGINLGHAWNNPDEDDSQFIQDNFYPIVNLAIGLHVNF